MQQIGVEDQDVACGACELRALGLFVEVERGCAGRGAMTAGDEARCAVVGAVVVEKSQHIHRIAGPLRRQVAMQALMAASHQGFAPLHLRKKEAFADQCAHHVQQPRQPADGLHLRIEVQHRVAPVRAARYGPLFRRRHARIERVAKVAQPFGWNRATQQGIAVLMQAIAVDHGGMGSVQGQVGTPCEAGAAQPRHWAFFQAGKEVPHRMPAPRFRSLRAALRCLSVRWRAEPEAEQSTQPATQSVWPGFVGWIAGRRIWVARGIRFEIVRRVGPAEFVDFGVCGCGDTGERNGQQR